MKKKQTRKIKQILAWTLVCILLGTNLIPWIPTLTIQAEEKVLQRKEFYENKVDSVDSMKNVELKNNIKQNSSSVLPTQEELQQWKEDGTLQERIDFMKSLGMYKASLRDFSKDVIDTIELDKDYPKNWTEGMPTTGNVKSLVFLIDFPDMKNDGTTPEDVETMLFSEEDKEASDYPYESLRAYYQRSSYGKLNISGEVYGWLRMKHNREYYNGEDAEASRQEIIKEILEAYDDQIDFSKYDSDQDGMVDSIYIYYAGGTEEWGTQWWSYVVTNSIQGEFADGMKVKKYCFFGDMSKVTAIHETGHLLGLPDYYDYEGIPWFEWNGENGGLGWFDMMDYNMGEHNIFSKMLLGWVKPVFLTEDTEIDLYPIVSQKAQAVIVTPNKDKNIFSEYYILEYYQQKENNINSVISDGAVKIYHIDASLNEIGTDFLNDNSYTEHKLIKLLESDGLEENGRYVFPIDEKKYYKESMEFGINTFPTSDFYYAVYSGIQIKIGKITEESAKVSVSFKEKDEKKPEFIGKVTQQSILNKTSQNMKDLSLYFDTQIYIGTNFENIKLVDKDTKKEIVVETEILNPRRQGKGYFDTKDRYNILVLNSKELEEGKQYQLIIPVNAIKDSYGNGNEEIVYEFSTNIGKENKEVVYWENIQDIEDYAYNGKVSDVLLDDHSILSCQTYVMPSKKELYFTFRRYNSNGNLLSTQEMNVIGDFEYQELSYQMYSMGNNKLLFLIENLSNPYYLIIDLSDLNYELKEIFKGKVYWGGGQNNFVKEYKDKIICLGMCQTENHSHDILDLYEYEVITFDKTSGKVQWEKKELIYDFSWIYYNDNLELDFIKLQKYVDFGNSQEGLFNQENESRQISAMYNRYERPSIYGNVQEVNLVNCHTTFSYNMTLLNVREVKLEILDDDFNKLEDINLAGYIGDNLAHLYPVQGQGYVIVITLNRSIKEVLRLDSDFNILWNSEIDVFGDVIDVIKKKKKVNLFISVDKLLQNESGNIDKRFLSYSWIQIDDEKNEIKYLSEDKTEFVKNTENMIIDKDSKQIKLKNKISLGDLKKSVIGNISEIKVYNDKYEEIKKDEDEIVAGLMKVTSTNGIYSYYYQINSDNSIKVKGDVDNSGKIDVNDALVVLKIAASLITPTEEQRKAADVNEDGKVDSGDALLILKYAAGLITEL